MDLALEHTELSPRELACRYTDAERYFVSESYFGRQYEMISERDRIKKRTMRKRKREYLASQGSLGWNQELSLSRGCLESETVRRRTASG